ncbi:hypothetical protein NBRC116494_02620 [Aurantivibrio plasticivorans]
MKALKIFLGIVVVLAIVIGGVSYYAVKNIDDIIKTAVEEQGSKAIGTQVTLGSAHVDWKNARVELKDLKIANPDGFSTDYVIALTEAVVDLNLDSLEKRVIILDEILVDGPSIIAEERDLKINLKQLADNLPKGESAKASESADSTSSAPEILLEVKKFTFSDANLQLVSQEYGDRTLTVPTISQTNLGSPNGVTPDVLAQQLIDRVLDSANDAVTKATKNAAKEKVREKAKEELNERLSDEDKEKLDDLRSLLKR